MIARSLKSLWHSDVILGASVGAVTSGLLVVLALVVAPLFNGSPQKGTSNAPAGTAKLPVPDRGATAAEKDAVKRAKERSRAAVDRRRDASNLPQPVVEPERSGRRGERPDPAVPAPRPSSPGTAITKVPVGAGLGALGAGAPTPSAIGEAATPASPRAGLRLRVRAASLGRENGDPELRLTMGITGSVPGVSLPEQVTVRLRPDIPSNPERAESPLALHAQVDVVEGAQPLASSTAETAAVHADSASATPGLRVRMALAPATADRTTVDEDAEGDGKSNVVKLEIPLTQFDKPSESPIPGVPTEAPAAPAPDEGSAPSAPSAPSEPAPSEPRPAEPAPAEPKPSTPAPSEPAAPSAPNAPAPAEPAPSYPAPSEPAPSTPREPAPSEPTPPEPAPGGPAPAEPAPTADPQVGPMQEIQVPLLVTPQPVTTVENTVLPLPPAVDPESAPTQGLRVVVSIQNALTDPVAADGGAAPATGDPAAPGAAPAPAAPDGTAAVADAPATDTGYGASTH